MFDSPVRFTLSYVMHVAAVLLAFKPRGSDTAPGVLTAICIIGAFELTKQALHHCLRRAHGIHPRLARVHWLPSLLCESLCAQLYLSFLLGLEWTAVDAFVYWGIPECFERCFGVDPTQTGNRKDGIFEKNGRRKLWAVLGYLAFMWSLFFVLHSIWRIGTYKENVELYRAKLEALKMNSEAVGQDFPAHDDC